MPDSIDGSTVSSGRLRRHVRHPHHSAPSRSVSKNRITASRSPFGSLASSRRVSLSTSPYIAESLPAGTIFASSPHLWDSQPGRRSSGRLVFIWNLPRRRRVATLQSPLAGQSRLHRLLIRKLSQLPSIVQPPSTGSAWPLINPLNAGSARNAIARATSSGVANLPIGLRPVMSASE